MDKPDKHHSNKVCSVDGCGIKHEAKGYCVKHYLRFKKTGSPHFGDRLYSTPEEAFEARVDKNGPNGCWVWNGAKTFGGYGHLGVRGELIRAHRYSWELHNGKIPKSNDYHGTCVLHKCDNPACANPEHLFLGSQKDNITDMMEKGRGHKAKGEANGRTNLTECDVRKIRADKRFQYIIAIEHGISKSTVGSIKRKEVWGHVE